MSDDSMSCCLLDGQEWTYTNKHGVVTITPGAKAVVKEDDGGIWEGILVGYQSKHSTSKPWPVFRVKIQTEQNTIVERDVDCLLPESTPALQGALSMPIDAGQRAISRADALLERYEDVTSKDNSGSVPLEDKMTDEVEGMVLVAYIFASHEHHVLVGEDKVDEFVLDLHKRHGADVIDSVVVWGRPYRPRVSVKYDSINSITKPASDPAGCCSATSSCCEGDDA